MENETVICKRDELYDQVWAEPMRTVAKRYGVSDVALAKICRKLRVPLPGRGFWAKKAAGYNLVAPKLPPLKAGLPSQHAIQRRYTDVESVADDPSAPPEAHIEVPEILEAPHQLVVRSESLVRRSARPGSTIEIGKHRCLDIRVGEQTVDRAIRIADTLIKTLEARGFPVSLTAPETTKPRNTWERPSDVPSKTRVLINEEYVEFALEEAHDTIAVDITKDPHYGTPRFRWRPSHEHRFNGTLTFRIKNAPSWRRVRHNWRDAKVQRVENLLNSIVHGLVAAANALRAERLEHERREREYAEQQRRWEEERLRREHEAKLVADLSSRLDDWRASHAIREFVAAVETDARERSGEIVPDTDLAQWIAWARQRADALASDAIQTVGELRTTRAR